MRLKCAKELSGARVSGENVSNNSNRRMPLEVKVLDIILRERELLHL